VLDSGYAIIKRETVDKDGWIMVYLELRKVLPWEVVKGFVLSHVLEIQRLWGVSVSREFSTVL
jgi:hypothetical protein